MISDIHFDLHDIPTWRAYRKWHSRIRPDRTIVLGDFLDLGMMSKYVQGPHETRDPIAQIRCFVAEVNALALEAKLVEVMEGNHDERWAKYVLGAAPDILKDAKGLSLREQCLAQGMDARVSWRQESEHDRGIQIGHVTARHGHKQSGKFGGGKHLCANRIMKSLGTSEAFGHHHRAQIFWQTAHGRTAVAVSNPCMTKPHSYAQDADWQLGFTKYEVHDGHAFPTVIVMNKGVFADGGRVYDGNF
jgi:predicted phosphodiesterase